MELDKNYFVFSAIPVQIMNGLYRSWGGLQSII